MHRLTQAILRARSTEPGKVRAHAEAIVTGNVPESTLAPGSWPAWGRLLPHLLALAPERSDNPGLQTATVHASAYLLDSGKVSDALSFATRIHGLWGDRLGPDDRQTLRIANTLVSAHRVAGHLSRARQFGEDLLGTSRRLHGDDDPDALDIASHLALVLHALGDYHATRELNEDTLQRCRRTLGDNHPATLMCAADFACDLRNSATPTRHARYIKMSSSEADGRKARTTQPRW